MLKINEQFNERTTVFTKFFIILLTICGCLISINQIFNIGFLNFNPVSNSFLYLLIAFFQPISFLMFPFNKKHKNKILVTDIIAAFSMLFLGLYFSINSENILSNGWNIEAPFLPTFLSFLLIILSLESLRRTGGIFIFYIAIFFTAYPIFADMMPGALWGNVYSIAEAAEHIAWGWIA